LLGKLQQHRYKAEIELNCGDV